jgi:hypothetical protein
MRIRLRSAVPGDRTINFAPALALAMEQQIIHRCFDLFEIALVSEWNSTSLNAIIEELREANRSLTNEKNFYLTSYESLRDPAFLLNESFEIIAANQAGDNHDGHYRSKDHGRRTAGPERT